MIEGQRRKRHEISQHEHKGPGSAQTDKPVERMVGEECAGQGHDVGLRRNTSAPFGTRHTGSVRERPPRIRHDSHIVVSWRLLLTQDE